MVQLMSSRSNPFVPMHLVANQITCKMQQRLSASCLPCHLLVKVGAQAQQRLCRGLDCHNEECKLTSALYIAYRTQNGRGRKGSLYMAYSGFNLLMYCGRNKDSADTMYLQRKVQSSQSAYLDPAAVKLGGRASDEQLPEREACAAHCTGLQL